MKRPPSLIFCLTLLVAPSACATKGQLMEFADEIDPDADGANNAIDCAPDDPDVQWVIWFLDQDGDGHGDPDSAVEACAAPTDGRAWVRVGDDCNDLNARVFEALTGFPDDDHDGFGRGLALLTQCDGGPDLAHESGDCDDADPDVFPGAPAVCGNGRDDDCDALPDCEAPGAELSATDADVRWSGDGEEALGATLTLPGDVNGDGVDDVVVGAPDDRGAAYVILGPFDGDLDIRDAAAHLVGDDGSAAGSALSGAGDVDGDGYDDFLVGAPGGAGGTAVLVYGPIRAVASEGGEADLSTASLDMVELRLEVDDDAEAGAALAAPGDLRGNDGQAELVVAAPGAGAVYVVRGPVDNDVSLGDDDSVQTISGATTLDLGRAVAAIGDLDGDGRAELAVGAPGYNSSMWGSFRGELGVGAAYVYFESGDLGVDDADVILYGDEVGAKFGATLADAGDMDGDGLGDLMVAAPFAASQAGEAWLFTGAVLAEGGAPGLGEAAASFYGSERWEVAGQFMLGGADVDFDGQPDLLLGSPKANWGAESSLGAVGLWYGPISGRHGTENADTRVMGEPPDEDGFPLFGWSIAFSGAGDLFVGSPGVGADEASTDGTFAFGDGATVAFHLGW